MFDSLTTLEQLPLLILLAAWAILLFGGFVFGKLTSDGARRMPAWTRMASSLTLVIAAWGWMLAARGTQAVSFALLVAVGMTLGLLGDLFMAKLIVRSEKHVLGGIAAFGLGHVAYIVGFIQFGDAIDANALRVMAWVIWLTIGLIGWYAAVYRGLKTHSVLHYAALPYALLLMS